MQEITFLDLIIIALTAWRVSSIIAYEEFAFGLATKLRKLLGVQSVYDLDEEGKKVLVELASHQQPTILARGITCIYCVSFWGAILLTGLLYIIPDIIFIYNMIAVGTLAIAVNKIING